MNLYKLFFFSEGLCLWTIETSSSSSSFSSSSSSLKLNYFSDPLRPTNAAWMNYLQHPAMKHITSVAWSPCGTYLAVGCGNDPTIVVWDVALEIATVLRRVGGGGTRELKWSPNGRCLAQGSV